MKKMPASRSAFFNPRLLVSFAFCSIGVFLAMVAFASSSGGTAALAQAPQVKQADVQPPIGPLGGPTTVGQLIISEFRVRGPNGANDEFIDIYNATGATLSTLSEDGSAGLAVAASDGVARCVIPNGTVIPGGGHYLCVNSVGYSLAGYPSGSGNTANGNATYTTDIPDQAGIAIFNNSTGGGSFSTANRIDAAGPTGEANTTYREGPGLPALTPFSIDYAWVRKSLGGGCTGSEGGANCNTVALVSTVLGPSSIRPQDTNNNASDFIFVDTNGTSAGGGQRLGAPGPQNLPGPGAIEGTVASGPNVKVLDPCASEMSPPNYVRDTTSVPATNSTFGTIDIRKTFTNQGTDPIRRLRFRVVDITTFPPLSGVADLRPRTSTDLNLTVDRSPCGAGSSSTVVHGTTLEQPPSQPNGAGYNSSLSADAVTLANPLAAGASIDVRFLLGVQEQGVARFCVSSETEPATPAQVSCFTPADITPGTAPKCGATLLSESFENVSVPALPPGWASTFTNGPADCAPSGTCAFGAHWLALSGENLADTGSIYLNHDDPSCVTDSTLDTPTIPIGAAAAGPQLTFRNKFITEGGFDGGVLEISSPNINGGNFTDIVTAGGTFMSGGYNGTISAAFSSPIAGRPAWTGNSVGYLTTTVNLPAIVMGESIRVRFRMATDCSVGIPGGGWSIDTIKVTAGACGPQALNISTRLQVQTDNNVLIGGFIVTGNTTKNMVARGIGPSLSQFGIPGVLADPTLELHASDGSIIVQNDNWQDDAAQASQISAAGLALQDPAESGIFATLQPGASYTAILAGKNGGTGVGLLEIYDINNASESQLANISTRGFVLTDSNVMIGGFILSGSDTTNIAVRGVGPSLSKFGINPALADPTLELHDGNGVLLIANDNWQDDPAQAALLTANGLALQDPAESGIFMPLPLGSFTAVLAGKNGGTGIGLVEIYNLH